MLIIMYVIGALIALIGGLLFGSKDEEKQGWGKKLLFIALLIGIIGFFF